MEPPTPQAAWVTRGSGETTSSKHMVSFSDGGHVVFSADLDGQEEFTDCAFRIRGMSSELTRFVRRIAKAGDIVILTAMEDFVPIMTSPEQISSLPYGLREDHHYPVTCGSAEELESLLSGGYAGCKRYRDRIARAPLE